MDQAHYLALGLTLTLKRSVYNIIAPGVKGIGLGLVLQLGLVIAYFGGSLGGLWRWSRRFLY